MKHSKSLFCVLGLVALMSGGCTMQMEGDPSPEELGQTQEASLSNWGPSTLDPATIAGMGLAPNGKYYTWRALPGDNRVWLCVGNTGASLCNESDTPTSTTNASNLRGVAIRPTDSHVIYYWGTGLSGTYTEGNSGDAFRYFSHKTFQRPWNPAPNPFTTFQMQDLLDVDISDNGRYYYYWFNSGNGRVYRTIGTASVADSHSLATHVSHVVSSGIVGIAFDSRVQPEAPIHTFYSNRVRNISQNSLDLDH